MVVDVVCVYLDQDGQAHLRILPNAGTADTIHLRVFEQLSRAEARTWSFVAAIEMTTPSVKRPTASLASFTAWEPTKEQLQKLRDKFAQEELRRIQKPQ